MTDLVITSDSELLTNYISAELVSDNGHFVACADSTGGPMAFRLTDAAADEPAVVLQLIRRGADGKPWAVYDFGALVSAVQGRQIQAFDLQQDNFFNIYMTIAVASGSGSQLLVLRPFKLAPNASLDASSAPAFRCFDLLPPQGTIFRLFMTPPQGTSSYPTTYVSYKSDGSVVNNSQLIRVSTDPSLPSNQCSLVNDTSIPEDSFQILDLATCNNKHGDGVYVLYTIQGQTKIVLITRAPDEDNPGHWFSYDCSITCPQGARSIATFVSSDGQSALVVSGSAGLWYFDTDIAQTDDGAPTLICSQDLAKNASQLQTSQSHKAIAIWMAAGDQELGYVSFSSDSPTQCSAQILLPAGSANNFSPMMSTTGFGKTASLWHTVLARSGNDGHMTLVRQCSDTSIWRSTSLAVAHSYGNVTKKCYTVTIRVRDSSNQPVQNAKLRISASAAIDVIMNNQYITMTTADVTYIGDKQGDLTFIIPTDSLGVSTLRISGYVDQTNKITPLSSSMNICPADKVMARLSEKVKTVTDLQNAKGSSGNSVWTNTSTVSDDDWSTAMQAITTLQDAHAKLPADGSKPANAPSAVQARSAGQSLTSVIEDDWNKVSTWFRNTATDIKEWGVQTFGTVWKLVLKLGDEFVELVIDCAEKVYHALHIVLAKLSALIDTIIDWLGYIFGFKDMITTSNTIASFINGAMDYAVTSVTDAGNAADTFISNLKTQLNTDPTLATTSVAGNQDSSSDDTRASSCQLRDSTPMQWVKYQLMHSASDSPSTDASPQSQQAVAAWNTIQSSLDKVKDNIKSTGKTLTSDFHLNSNVTDTTSMLKTVTKNILISFLDVIQAIIDAGKTVIVDLINDFKSLVNKTINIPIFSALYKDLTGETLTIINAASLLVAIPTTILSKAIISQAPATFDDPEKLVGQIWSDDSSLDDGTKDDFNNFMTSVSLAYGFVKLPLDLITSETDEGGEGGEGGGSWAGFIFDFVQCLYATLNTLTTLTIDTTLPAADIRAIITCVTCTQSVADMIFTNNPALKDVPNVEDYKSAMDLGFCLTNFALLDDVYNAELTSTTTSWPDKDDTASGYGVASNCLNCIAGASGFVEEQTAEEPEVALIAAAVEAIAERGDQVVGILLWKHQVGRQQGTMLPPNAV